MKKRHVTVILLIFAVLIGLCACGTGENKSENSKESLVFKDEIVEAYELDDTGKKLVRDLFGEFDGALKTLKKSQAENKDFYDYAESVFTAFSDFDEIFLEKYQSKLQEKWKAEQDTGKKNNYIAIHTKYIGYSNDANFKILDFLRYDEEWGESLAEDAFNFVNELSDFFCGVYRITDEDLDALA